jgi:acetylornithine deacetylase/succinyl-diaminopimelate desuccinylase-like protein
MVNTVRLSNFVNNVWDNSIIPALSEYIRIPNKSPAFDPQWHENGYMAEAVGLLTQWAEEQHIPGMTLEVTRLPGRTPLIYMEIPGQIDDTVLLYGHLDKQPEMTGWHEDLSPWEPVIKGDKLYGRGGADDGYAIFASLTAIKALHDQKIPHARCIIIIEACEESGSYDLPYYIEALTPRIGNPSLIVCLDSGCGNYEQLWSTTSLRGLAAGVLSIELLKEGVHSGNGSGIIASSFRVLRQLLSRIEDENTGKFLIEAMNTQIPAQRIEQAKLAAHVLGEHVYCEFPTHPSVQPITHELAELVLNRTWRPTLSVIGVAGIPSLDDAGNVLRPKTAVKLSVRLPPNCNAQTAIADFQRILETDPPYGAVVKFTPEKASDGWDAPALSNWLQQSTEEASQTYFGKPAMYMGEGGSIPFMGMLGKKFPQAQFLISGLLGPHSNAHGPNEFLHIPTGKRLTACVAHVIAKHAQRGK